MFTKYTWMALAICGSLLYSMDPQEPGKTGELEESEEVSLIEKLDEDNVNQLIEMGGVQLTPLQLIAVRDTPDTLEQALQTPGIEIHTEATLQIRDNMWLHGNILHILATINADDKVKVLLENAPNLDVNATGYVVTAQEKTTGVTPLHLAALVNSAAFITALLRQSTFVYVNQGDEDRETPLHYATKGGAEDAVQALLKEGQDKSINVNARAYNDLTPLHFAAFFGRTDIMVIMFAHAGDTIEVNALSQHEKSTPLRYVMQSDFADDTFIRMFLSRARKRVDVNVQGEDQNTPLHIAMRARNLDKAKALVESDQTYNLGLNGNIEDAAQRTPLEDAIHIGYLEGAQYLMTVPGIAIRDKAISEAMQQNYTEFAARLRVHRALHDMYASVSYVSDRIQSATSAS